MCELIHTNAIFLFSTLVISPNIIVIIQISPHILQISPKNIIP